jgi:hypothetical protein
VAVNLAPHADWVDMTITLSKDRKGTKAGHRP